MLVTFSVLLLAVVGGVSYFGWRQSVPGARVILTSPSVLGRNTRLALTVEASRGELAAVEVRLVQRGQSIRLLHEERPGRRAEITVAMEAAADKIREGSAVLEVWAQDTFWRPLRFDDRATVTFPVTLDLTPPKLEVLAATRSVAPGGAGVVVARTTGAARVETRVGELAFPTFGAGDDPSIRVGLIALPHDFVPGTRLNVVAEDEAGNRTVRSVPSEVRSRSFPRDRIELSDRVLRAKIAELLPQRSPAQSVLEGFLSINRDQRQAAEEMKRRIGRQSGAAPLWRGVFVQPRSSKVFSRYGETRTYRYQGQDVDTQVHLGYDLASTRQAAVAAANAGVVVFAGPMTIYGNMIVVDHGQGLMTLYAHLSSMDVAVGDRVEKGQRLGRTGTTGLALADHLHYEVLVHGLSVTPLEWWDAGWIGDHIEVPLRAVMRPTE